MENNGRVTMAVLSAKQDMMLDELRKHCAILEQHIKDDKAVELKVDRLEQKEINRNRHFWVIYPTLIASYIAWIFGR